MKIAVISPVPVFPPFGGNRSKILQFIRILEGMGHEVHFILLPSRQIGDVDPAALEAHFGGRLHVLARTTIDSGLYYLRRVTNRVARAAIKLADATRDPPMPLDEIYYWPFTRQLRALQEQIHFDAVVVEYVLFSKALEAFPKGVLKIIDTHDAQTHRIGVEGETRGFRRADVILAIQSNDEATFRSQIGPHGPRVITVSHVSELGDAVALDRCEGATFLGSDFEANTESLNYFLERILPLVRARRPEFTFFVAGSICKRVGEAPGVVRLGKVDRVADAYARGPISINPITGGTGIKIKLLESMALGVPVVTTVFGVKGIADEFTQGAVKVADGDPAAFAEAVLDLFTDVRKRRELGSLARKSAAHWNATQISNLERVLETRAD